MLKQEIDDLTDSILKSLTRSAKVRFKERYAAARAELEQFNRQVKSDLANYTLALDNGDLTPGQFKQLVGDNLRLAEMKGLTQAGISVAEMDAYKSAALRKIVSTTLKVVVPEGSVNT
ncbi:MAG: hypothetical protein IPM98_12275 [Lewinellaceae bacterium]|nr:hypothetical protein [Lewinellaceae bacterium]